MKPSEWWVSPRQIDNPLEIWEMGPFSSKQEAEKTLQYMKNKWQEKVGKYEKFARDEKDKSEKKYYEEAVKKYKEALATVKIAEY